MTLKEIKNQYYVLKMDGNYHIHSKEVGGRTVHKYLCTIEKTKNYKFNVIGYAPVNTLEKLNEQINDYLNNLEYDSEYYSPLYRKGTSQEFLLIDLLNEYGFKRGGWDEPDGFNLKRNSIYGGKHTSINLNYSIDVEEELIKIYLYNSDFSWVETKTSFNFKDIHKKLNGLLKPLLLTEGIENIKISDKMQDSDIDLIIKELKGFDISSSKVNLKNKLLELAETI